MSYQAAAALQAAIYARLSSTPALAGVSIVDAVPAGTSLGSFLLIGPEQAWLTTEGFFEAIVENLEAAMNGQK